MQRWLTCLKASCYSMRAGRSLCAGSGVIGCMLATEVKRGKKCTGLQKRTRGVSQRLCEVGNGEEQSGGACG